MGRPRRHTGRSLERVEVYHARGGAATAGTPRRRALDGVATPLRCRPRAAASLWAAARCQAARRAARRPWSAWAEAVADDTPIAREAHTMCGKLWNHAGSA
ncbi:MAG: hypothetical protein M3380_07695 [Chloroflexota bacterium]|nr:hypothetical protein [Chloroflexota bacterium]